MNPQKTSTLQYDKEFQISTASGRTATKWKPTTTTIQTFVDRISTTKRTPEKFADYLELPKDQQDDIKDTSAFVGGSLKQGSRKKENVVNRQILTFDLDYCTSNIMVMITNSLTGICYTVYSTHKHCPERPRLRLIVYPDRPLTVAEYEPVCRKVAGKVGIDCFDDSCYQVNRLFYMPTTSIDGEFLIYHNDCPFIPIDKILAEYGPDDEWTDTNLWPRSCRESEIVVRAVKSQSNPLDKKNIVGAFCRQVSIWDAIENHLGDVYKKGLKGRYSYIAGSTSNGLAIYDGCFAYSNHSTDPATGQCCNAFDLIRIHKFADLDHKSRAGTLPQNLPSYMAMAEYAETVDGVTVDLIKSGLKLDIDTFDVFDAAGGEENENAKAQEAGDEWLLGLQRTEKGIIKPTWFNLVTILKNDPKINGKMRFNDFSHMVEKPDGSNLTKEEIYQVRTYIGSKYRLHTQFNDVKQAIETRAFENRYHPVRDYLEDLYWDGMARVETVFIDYVGSIDNPYVREAARCWFAAAVYRVFEPGFKFDTAIVLSGPQGVGKTRFISTLALDKWYGELSSFDPKIATEEVSGKWILEISEMGATNKQALEQQKSFLSACHTRTRLAYEPLPVDYKRQCVFIGSTNELEYLKDSTGNRRWWPIDCDVSKIDIDKLKANINQIWAESYLLYKKRAKVWLEDSCLRLAIAAQEDKREPDPWEGIIGAWLQEECSKRRYDNNYSQFEDAPEDMVTRDRVCIPEVWRDCLKGKGESTAFERKRIGRILTNNPDFLKTGAMRFGVFGIQKAWKNDVPF